MTGVLSRQDHLERDHAIELGLAGLVHDSHPAAAQHALDFVAGDARHRPGHARGALAARGGAIVGKKFRHRRWCLIRMADSRRVRRLGHVHQWRRDNGRKRRLLVLQPPDYGITH